MGMVGRTSPVVGGLRHIIRCGLQIGADLQAARDDVPVILFRSTLRLSLDGETPRKIVVFGRLLRARRWRFSVGSGEGRFVHITATLFGLIIRTPIKEALNP